MSDLLDLAESRPSDKEPLKTRAPSLSHTSIFVFCLRTSRLQEFGCVPHRKSPPHGSRGPLKTVVSFGSGVSTLPPRKRLSPTRGPARFRLHSTPLPLIRNARRAMACQRLICRLVHPAHPRDGPVHPRARGILRGARCRRDRSNPGTRGGQRNAHVRPWNRARPARRRGHRASTALCRPDHRHRVHGTPSQLGPRPRAPHRPRPPIRARAGACSTGPSAQRRHSGLRPRPLGRASTARQCPARDPPPPAAHP